jgi:hypothetical protein
MIETYTFSKSFPSDGNKPIDRRKTENNYSCHGGRAPRQPLPLIHQKDAAIMWDFQEIGDF